MNNSIYNHEHVEHQYSVLIVDDNDLNLDLISSIFESRGHAVYRAISGREGLKLAQIHLPDVILMDLAMPEMDGIESTQALKQNPVTSQIPVVACSAVVTHDMRKKAFQAGCIGYIAKPVEPSYLIQQVTKHVLAANRQRRVVEYA